MKITFDETKKMRIIVTKLREKPFGVQMLVIVLLFLVSLASFIIGVCLIKNLYPSVDTSEWYTEYDQNIDFVAEPFEF